MTDTDRLANANPAAVSLTGMAAGDVFFGNCSELVRWIGR